MIPQTDAEVGPADPHWTYQFQKRYGIKFDGVYGRQVQGQIACIEGAYAEMYARWLEASRKPEIKCSPWGFLAGAVTTAVAWMTGALDWLHAIFP